MGIEQVPALLPSCSCQESTYGLVVSQPTPKTYHLLRSLGLVQSWELDNQQGKKLLSSSFLGSLQKNRLDQTKPKFIRKEKD